MSITFYYGSGSPFAWTVWLSLEHKQVPYEFRRLMFDKGETRSPEFLAINPRGKVPAIVHEGHALWESSAIVEYLDERFPSRSLFGTDIRTRYLARRICSELNSYLYPPQRSLMQQTLFRPQGNGDAAIIRSANEEIAREFTRLSTALTGPYFAGELTAADYVAYPIFAILRRVHEKMPQHSNWNTLPSRLTDWMKRIESLPYFEKTIPPHWK